MITLLNVHTNITGQKPTKPVLLDSNCSDVPVQVVNTNGSDSIEIMHKA